MDSRLNHRSNVVGGIRSHEDFSVMQMPPMTQKSVDRSRCSMSSRGRDVASRSSQSAQPRQQVNSTDPSASDLSLHSVFNRNSAAYRLYDETYVPSPDIDNCNFKPIEIEAKEEFSPLAGSHWDFLSKTCDTFYEPDGRTQKPSAPNVVQSEISEHRIRGNDFARRKSYPKVPPQNGQYPDPLDTLNDRYSPLDLDPETSYDRMYERNLRSNAESSTPYPSTSFLGKYRETSEPIDVAHVKSQADRIFERNMRNMREIKSPYPSATDMGEYGKMSEVMGYDLSPNLGRVVGKDPPFFSLDVSSCHDYPSLKLNRDKFTVNSEAYLDSYSRRGLPRENRGYDTKTNRSTTDVPDYFSNQSKPRNIPRRDFRESYEPFYNNLNQPPPVTDAEFYNMRQRTSDKPQRPRQLSQMEDNYSSPRPQHPHPGPRSEFSNLYAGVDELDPPGRQRYQNNYANHSKPDHYNLQTDPRRQNNRNIHPPSPFANNQLYGNSGGARKNAYYQTDYGY